MKTENSPNSIPEVRSFDTKRWDAELQKAATARNRKEMQWHTNMAFYDGKQWLTWVKNPATNLGATLTLPRSRRKRLVFNKIRPTIRNEYTKLVKQEPQYVVNPATAEQSDVMAAKTAGAIAEYLLYHAGFNKTRRSATWWACQTGVGFIKTFYDPNKDINIRGADGNSIPGCVVYERVTPFHLFVPHLDFEDIEDQPWVIHARTYDPVDVERMYDKKIEGDTAPSQGTYESRFLSALNVPQDSRFKQAYVKELWMKPNPSNPQGRFVVWCKDTVLYDGPFPYDHGEYPFAKIGHIPSGGFYDTSVIEDLIPPQKEYNLVKSQIAEARDMTAKPAFTYTRGSIEPKDMVAEPGKLIGVMPGADGPKRLINPDLPAYVQQDLERTVTDMDQISGQYEITKGRTPPGVEAASAIAFLQEENDTRLYHTIASIEEAVTKIGRQSLELVKQYWDETRIIKTVSTTHLQATIEFLGKDLKQNTDFRVLPESMAPKSRAAKQAQIMEYVKLGLISPELALKSLDQMETTTLYDESQVDTTQAIRENLRMARGEQLEPNEWDNHEKHVYEHEKFMKGEDFELLSDEQKQIFVAHRQMHMMIAVGEVLAGSEDQVDGTEVPVGTEENPPTQEQEGMMDE
jgi:hypothetical protein